MPSTCIREARSQNGGIGESHGNVLAGFRLRWKCFFLFSLTEIIHPSWHKLAHLHIAPLCMHGCSTVLEYGTVRVR